MKCSRFLTIFISLVTIVLLSGCTLLSDIPSPGNSTVRPSAIIDPGWRPPQVAAGNLSPDYSGIVASITPAVVAITVQITSYDIFNIPYTTEGAGSGWIIDSNGIIVTNSHVIENSDNITVTLNDGGLSRQHASPPTRWAISPCSASMPPGCPPLKWAIRHA